MRRLLLVNFSCFGLKEKIYQKESWTMSLPLKLGYCGYMKLIWLWSILWLKSSFLKVVFNKVTQSCATIIELNCWEGSYFYLGRGAKLDFKAFTQCFGLWCSVIMLISFSSDIFLTFYNNLRHHTVQQIHLKFLENSFRCKKKDHQQWSMILFSPLE